MNPVFFLSDFGIKDYYVAAVKAVMYRICPHLEIIDITHEITPFNVKEGAFILYQIAPFIPEGSIVLAVVDPGVGTERKAIVVRGRRHIFVAPDNGLVYPAASAQGIVEIREIKENGITLPRSGTFDARDVFGPVAAYLACDLSLEDVGPPLSTMIKLSLESAKIEEGFIEAEVMHIDRFGNIVTDIPTQGFEAWRSSRTEFSLITKKVKLSCTYSKSYQSLGDRLGIIPGSSGLMELSLKEGSAAEKLKASTGEKLLLKKL